MRAGLVAVILALLGCSASDHAALGGPESNTGSSPPPPPTQPPPTGGRWKGVTVENECGRTTIEWVVVDEACGDTESPRYLDAFEAPMFRDGAIVGGLMYAVDASGLWVLDVSAPTAPVRRALFTGFGRPLAAREHAGRVLLAAGDSGLLVADVTDPLSPVVAAALPLDGVALDVHVEGDTAYVAAGSAGLHVVDLSTASPVLLDTIPVPGFAAGVTSRGTTAYVAACTTFAVVDLTTSAVVGHTWLADAHQGDLLVAPAKDVELVGDVAFVAAGRYGAVAVDVSQPQAPAVLGNCTLDDDLSFYASGVRADSTGLFVAGGEWGILRVETADAPAACSVLSSPLVFEPAAPGSQCSEEPPWEVLDWEDRWAPPPPPPPSPPGIPPRGRDPIQVLPQDGVLYAFGDARRLGLRAVDVRDPLDPVLARLGRYDEPWLVEAVAVRASKLLVVGATTELFDVLTDGTLVKNGATLPTEVVAGDLLDDGRWVVGRKNGDVIVEGASTIVTGQTLWSGSLVARGADVLVATPTGIVVFDDQGLQVGGATHGRSAHLPPAVTLVGGDVVVAAPEWPAALELRGAQITELPSHGVFDEAEILDTSLWQAGIPRRVLVAAGDAAVEVATLGTRAGLYDHATGGRVALPAGTYAGGAWAGDRVHLAVADRGRYRSQLVTVSLGEAPVVEAIESFTGVATDVAADGAHLFVGDADGAVRVYAIDATGRPRAVHVERVGGGT